MAIKLLKPTAKRSGPGACGRDDVLHVHFKGTGHTYRVHAGTRRQALLDKLAKLNTAIGSPVIKNLMTVLAIIEFLGPDAPRDSLAPLFALLTPAAFKHNWDLVRGSIATGVEMLRFADMEDLQIKRWLDEEIKRRAMDFSATEAVQWYYECRNGKASKTTLEIFRTFRPKPSTSLTEAVAKERVTEILDRAVGMKAGRPLTRSRRRR